MVLGWALLPTTSTGRPQAGHPFFPGTLVIPNRVKWREVRDLLLVEKTSLMAPGAIVYVVDKCLRWKHWNISVNVFFGGFFSTGIPTSSYFLAASNRGLGGPTARSSEKIRQNGGWEAGRLDPAGMIIPPAAPGTRADEGGGPSQGFLYGWVFFTWSVGGP